MIQQLEINEHGFSVRQVDEDDSAPTYEMLMQTSVDYKDPIDSSRDSGLPQMVEFRMEQD